MPMSLLQSRSRGGTVFIDPQNGSANVRWYFDYVLEGKTELCRIDNLEVTELIKECCEEYVW